MGGELEVRLQRGWGPESQALHLLEEHPVPGAKARIPDPGKVDGPEAHRPCIEAPASGEESGVHRHFKAQPLVTGRPPTQTPAPHEPSSCANPRMQAGSERASIMPHLA